MSESDVEPMADDALPAFGDLLRQARRHAGLTQEALAERAGVSVRGISDLERGLIQAPRKDTLDFLSDALDLAAGERRLWDQARRRSSARSAVPARPSNGSDATTNLPASLTTLIGRERELDDLVSMLRMPGRRLVTVTGTGGVGKTRFALAVGHALLSSFPDGVWFVDLAPLRDPDLVVSTIATVVNIVPSASQPVLTTLSHGLRNKRLLLVLDNFEQVVRSAPGIADLLSSCSSVTVLVTSRVPLHVSGEQEYLLEPLAVPLASDAANLDQLRQSDSVTLFIERARAVRPDFALSSENAPAVIAICRSLDGLPLSLELAAARIRLLPPEAILQRLDQRLTLLRNPAQAIPDRHRTLRDTIDWSYSLLSPDEQHLFRTLSVFRGGWTLEAAEAVIPERIEDDALDILERLVEHGLVRVCSETGETARYTMLETIREFGMERLEANGETDDARRRHGAHVISRIEALLEEADSGRNQRSRSWLYPIFDHEFENIRAALAWGLEHDPDLVLRGAAAMEGQWMFRGLMDEGRRWLEAGLVRADNKRDLVRAKALNTSGTLSNWLDDAPLAMARHQESLELFRGLDHDTGIVWAMFGIARTHHFAGEYDMARPLYEECRVRARGLEDRWLILITSGNLGGTMLSLGDIERAIELMEEALSIARADGQTVATMLWLSALGDCYVQAGDLHLATERLRESLHLSKQLGEKRMALETMEAVAAVANERDSARAARLFGASAMIRDALQYPRPRHERELYAARVASTRAKLGEASFVAEWEAGQRMTPDEAIDYALSDDN